MKRLIALMICVALLGLSAVAETGMLGKGKGYLTPDGAISAYLEGLRNQDIEQMMSVFPWEHFDVSDRFRDVILGNSSYTPESWPVFPGKTNLERDINAALLYCQAADDLCRFFAILTYPDRDSFIQNNMPVSMLRTAPVKTDEDVGALLASFDLSGLDAIKGIDNIRILTPDEATDGAYGKYKRLDQTLERLRVRYGANKICERAVYFTIGLQDYVFAPVLARYGLFWYLVSFNGYLAARLDINGATGPFRPAGDAVEPASLTGESDKSSTDGLPWKEVGGSTPEEAVALYLEGLRLGDLEKIMSAFAWDTMRQRTVLGTAVQATAYYSGTNNWPVFPEGNAMLGQLDLAMQGKLRLSKLALSLVDYATQGAVFNDQQWMIQRRLQVRGEEEADAVIALFDTDRMEQLATLDIISIGTASDMLPQNAVKTVRDNAERYRTMYGADELTELVAVCTIGGEDYVIMPQLVRYGERWYISTMNSVAAMICNMPMANIALCKLSAI